MNKLQEYLKKCYNDIKEKGFIFEENLLYHSYISST